MGVLTAKALVNCPSLHLHSTVNERILARLVSPAEKEEEDFTPT